jgi:hypothetical protein
MVRFGKKDDKATKTQRYRYDLSSVADQEITDVLLTQKEEAPLAAALLESEMGKGDEVIYELVVEDKNTAEKESPDTVGLSEQVEKLCREYEAINQQLAQSLVAANELSQQLEKSKKVVAASYVALAGAGLAFLVGIAAVVVGISMQRDVADLTNSVSALAAQTAVVKKDSTLTTKDMNARIAQLDEKVDKIFAMDNLDTVLQVTRELRKQVNALAHKNLAMMNLHDETTKAHKILLPSFKLNAEKPLQSDKKLSDTQRVDKSVLTTAQPDAAKKAQDDKLASVSNVANDAGNANWMVAFGTFKDSVLAKEAAHKFEKAGVLVDIIQLKNRKHPRYRVVSKAFKNKLDALNHADYIEKTLGFHSAVLTKTR